MLITPCAERTVIRVGTWGFYNIREMPKNSKKYEPKSFESDGNASDTSANIYMSMLMSYAWQQLSKNAQVLYVYCKAQ